MNVCFSLNKSFWSLDGLYYYTTVLTLLYMVIVNYGKKMEKRKGIFRFTKQMYWFDFFSHKNCSCDKDFRELNDSFQLGLK